MTSILKVDQLQDSGGNALITSDGSGNLTTQKLLYPAWFVNLSADQSSIAETTATKIQFNTVVTDTDNAYDNTTNYRWTCPSGKAGKYKIELALLLRTPGDVSSNLSRGQCYIYKNGSEVAVTFNDLRNNPVRKNHLMQSLILDVAVGDYLEGFGWGQSIDAGGLQFMGDAAHESWFLGYRIGT